jgi:hypothetical protein
MSPYFADNKEDPLAGLFFTGSKTWSSSVGIDPTVFDLCFDKILGTTNIYDPAKGHLLMRVTMFSGVDHLVVLDAVPFVPLDKDN